MYQVLGIGLAKVLKSTKTLYFYTKPGKKTYAAFSIRVFYKKIVTLHFINMAKKAYGQNP